MRTLLLLAVISVIDKRVMSVTCWHCTPCKMPSTWTTCSGEMCYNITDAHGRGTPSRHSSRWSGIMHCNSGSLNKGRKRGMGRGILGEGAASQQRPPPHQAPAS